MPRTRGRKSKASESKEEAAPEVQEVPAAVETESDVAQEVEGQASKPKEEVSMQETISKEEEEQLLSEEQMEEGDASGENADEEQPGAGESFKKPKIVPPPEPEEKIERYKPQEIPGFSNSAIIEKWEWHMRVFPIDQTDIRSCVLESVSKIAQETWMYIDKQNYGMGAFDLCMRNCNDSLVVMSKLLQMPLMYRYVTVEITKRGRSGEKMKTDAEEDDDEDEDVPYTEVLEKATVLLDYVHTPAIERVKGKEMKRSLFVKYLPENTSKELLKVLFPTANNLDILTTGGGRRYAELNVSTASNVLALYNAYVTIQINNCKTITLEWREEKVGDGVMLKRATKELPWEIIPRNIEYEYESVPIIEEDENRSFQKIRREQSEALRKSMNKSSRWDSGRERGDIDAGDSNRRRDHDRDRHDRRSDHKERRRGDDGRDRSRDLDRDRRRNMGWEGGFGRRGGRWNGPQMGGFGDPGPFPFYGPRMGPGFGFDGPMPPFDFDGPRPRFDNFGSRGGRFEERPPLLGSPGRFDGPGPGPAPPRRGRPSRFDQPGDHPPRDRPAKPDKRSKFDNPKRQDSQSSGGEYPQQGGAQDRGGSKGGNRDFDSSSAPGAYNKPAPFGGFGQDKRGGAGGNNFRDSKPGNSNTSNNYGGNYQSKFGNQGFGENQGKFGGQMGMGNQSSYSTMQGGSQQSGNQNNYGNQSGSFGMQNNNFNNQSQGYFNQQNSGNQQQGFGNQHNMGGNQQNMSGNQQQGFGGSEQNTGGNQQNFGSNQQNYGGNQQQSFGGNQQQNYGGNQQSFGGNQQQNYGNQQSFGNQQQQSYSSQQNYNTMNQNFDNQQKGNMGANAGMQNYGSSNYNTQGNYNMDNNQQNYSSQQQNYGNYSTQQMQDYNSQGQQQQHQQQNYSTSNQQQNFSSQQNYNSQQQNFDNSQQSNYTTQQNFDQLSSTGTSGAAGGYWGQNNYSSSDQSYSGMQQQNQSNFSAPGTGFTADAAYASQGLYSASQSADSGRYGGGTQSTSYNFSQYQSHS